MSATNPDRLLSVREAAALLGLKAPTVYKMVTQRRLAFVKPGGVHGRVLFSPHDIEAFIASHRVPTLDEQARAPGSEAGHSVLAARALPHGRGNSAWTRPR